MLLVIYDIIDLYCVFIEFVNLCNIIMHSCFVMFVQNFVYGLGSAADKNWLQG